MCCQNDLRLNVTVLTRCYCLAQVTLLSTLICLIYRNVSNVLLKPVNNFIFCSHSHALYLLLVKGLRQDAT